MTLPPATNNKSEPFESGTIANQPALDSWDIKKMHHMILDKARTHVYNKMPIRLLAFSPIDSDPQLVDRNEILARVLKHTYAGAEKHDFVAEWVKEVPGDDDLLFQLRTKRERMITKLVSHHARYAILSHTWIRDNPGDVVFQDWVTRNNNPRGNQKILKFCEVAAKGHNVNFGWMDTVCIDKTSSSELDESIRSMYKWYRDAHACIAFLSETDGIPDIPYDSWFTRGWTLQELLAPHKIWFYNKDWQDFLSTMAPNNSPASSADKDIKDKILEATTITPHEAALCRAGKVDEIPISRRLQLAARRQVTREEDAVYSVMGLLGVDISTAYIEGSERAFFRLVRELLITKKNVLDLFNYGYVLAHTQNITLIPRSISQYIYRTSAFDTKQGDVSSLLDQWSPPEPVSLTHMGVRIPVLLAYALEESASGRLSTFREKLSSSRDDFSGRFELVSQLGPMHNTKSTTYRLSPLSNLHFNGTDLKDAIIHVAMLNFMADDYEVELPRKCLAIPLESHSFPPGHNRMRIIPAARPLVIELQAKNDRYKVARGELNRHGLYLHTLYL